MSKVGSREAELDTFLKAAGWGHAKRQALPGDASFRRYHRLKDGSRRALAMDAPPPKEDVRPFLTIARHLRGLGLSAPAIYAEDVRHGFLLLEDFGDATFTRLLAQGGDERALYEMALDTLVALHRHPDAIPPGLAPYDDERLLAEAALLPDWYMPEILGRPTPDAVRTDYLARWRALFPLARAVPETLVLRDYHVDNLMRIEGRAGLAACGLLDFQDAVVGPVTYDLMSLIEDARRDIDPELARHLRARYRQAFPALDPQAFDASMAILGAQRHCKVIGIFTRLMRRDGKQGYLVHIPRLWRLLDQALAHPALAPIADWLARHLPPDQRDRPG
ncbi:MAG: phosphotransferase [Rhodospirillales bacterium]|nr:phosphotransferase [Rhodospirillales bacterium]